MLSTSAERALAWLTASLNGAPVPPLVVAIGLGDGGLLEALEQTAPGTRVLALEPDPAATFEPALGLGATWRAAGRLVYLTAPGFAGADEAWRVFPANPDDHHLFVHPESAQRAREQAVRAARVVQQILFGARANAEARRQFAAPYLHNTLQNALAIARGADVTALRDVYAGTPAIVVGAGPSLDAAMPALARAAAGALVVATDTTLRPLLHAGIVPPLVAGLDPSMANAKHFLALPECRDSWLVAESALAPAAVSAFAGRTFWFRAAAHHPWPFLAAHGVRVGDLPVWGSVLTAAYQVALLAGCDPIVFVGADLAFTGGQPYARGTTYEFDWAYSTALGTPLAHVWAGQMAMRECVPAVDVHGRETVTTAPLLSFRDWIVAQAASSGRRVVNASGDGILHGGGIQLGDLEAVVGRGRPVLPMAVVPKPPACADTARLRAGLSAARRAVVAGQGSEAQAWAAFAGERYDVDAVTRALDDALKDHGSVATLQSFVPWAALPPSLASYEQLCRLPERMAAHHARLNGLSHLHESAASTFAAPLSADEFRALTALLTSLVGRLGDYHDTPGSRGERHVPMGRPAVAGEQAWPIHLAWPMQLFESAAVTAAAASENEGFHNAPVRLRDVAAMSGGTPAPENHDVARAQARLVAEWLRMAVTAAGVTVSDAAAATRLLRVVDAAADAADAGACESAAALTVQVGDERPVVVRVGIDERPLARVMTGALVPAAVSVTVPARHDPPLAVSLRTGAWQARCALAPPGHGGGHGTSALWAPDHVPPLVLTEAGLARSAFAYSTAHGAVCVGIHARESLLVRPDGTVTPHLAWPRPIIGELPFGDGGAVAWNNGTAEWPSVGDGYVLYRRTTDGPVEIETLPFRPTQGTWWQGRLFWSTFKTGIGAWAPGVAPQQWLTDQSFSGVRPCAGGLVLQACALDAYGGYERRLVQDGWRLTAAGALERFALGRHGAATSEAAHPQGWRATAYPQADLVTLRHPTLAAVDLTCYDPLSLAWAGDALLVCTGAGDVLLFQDLVRRLPPG